MWTQCTGLALNVKHDSYSRAGYCISQGSTVQTCIGFYLMNMNKNKCACTENQSSTVTFMLPSRT